MAEIKVSKVAYDTGNLDLANVLVYDLETDSFDTEKATIKIFGCYSFRDKAYYIIPFDKLYFAKQLVAQHRILVGFNNKAYDDPILLRHGFDMQYHTSCDCMMSVKKRVTIIKTDDGLLADNLMTFSLDAVSKALKLSTEGKIKDFDYGVLNKSEWTADEYDSICQYTYRDLELTTRLWLWLENFFFAFGEFIKADDVKKKKHITASPAALAYKAICHATGLPEEYNDIKKPTEVSYEGAYVAYPPGEHYSGTIHLLDFSSLYPHCFLQCNLFSPVSAEDILKGKPYWTGDKTIKVEGFYDVSKRGKIEELFISWYKKRQEYKKLKDKREYCLKIFLNASYGASGSEKFKSIYNKTTASDCTLLARQFILYARGKFRDAGYKLLMTDTDSIALLDHLNDKQHVLTIRDQLITELKSHLPFPADTFDMAYESAITDFWFFKGGTSAVHEDLVLDPDDAISKPLGLLKKNYIYRTTDSKVVVKNLGFRKKSCSAISKHIFWKILVPRISAERIVKFSKPYLAQLINDLLTQDLSLAAVRYNVHEAHTYKNASQLQAQIATKHGAGIHYLIPNHKVGVGKGRKYATFQEFNNAHLTIKDIDLAPVWSELSYVTEQQDLNIGTLNKYI